MRAPASTRMMTVRKGREDEAAREAPLTTRSWGRLTAPASARPWGLGEPLAWAGRRAAEERHGWDRVVADVLCRLGPEGGAS